MEANRLQEEWRISGARMVTPDAVVNGSLLVRSGHIAAVDAGPARSGGEDWEGDYLLPGLVELHTDNLERHLVPRPGVFWPAFSAVLAHDAQIAAAGITTVLDAVALGDVEAVGNRSRYFADAVREITRASGEGLLRAEHLLHLRCEVTAPNVIELYDRYAEHPLLRLVSLMDHTPGQRQWRDLAKHREFNLGRNYATVAEYEAMVERRKEHQARYAEANRQALVGRAHSRGLPLASHDDTTPEDVEQALGEQVTIAEFPTTSEAARLAHGHGMRVVMGGPNVVRGESHSGNVSARELAGEGLLDAVSSDYMPASLLMSALHLWQDGLFTLPEATALLSDQPAAMVGLHDRGRIEPGRRADLLRLHLVDGAPVVRAVYREGRRIA